MKKCSASVTMVLGLLQALLSNSMPFPQASSRHSCCEAIFGRDRSKSGGKHLLTVQVGGTTLPASLKDLPAASVFAGSLLVGWR